MERHPRLALGLGEPLERPAGSPVAATDGGAGCEELHGRCRTAGLALLTKPLGVSPASETHHSRDVSRGAALLVARLHLAWLGPR